MSPSTWNPILELQSAISELTVALQRAAEHATLGDRAAQRLNSDDDLPDPRIVMMFGAAPGHASSLADARTEFCSDCSRYGVLGMVAATEAFTGRVLHILKLAELCAAEDGPLDFSKASALREVMPRKLKDLRARGVLKALKKGSTVDRVYEEREAWFLGCYSLRTCLVHRSGRVGASDVEREGVLEATWLASSVELDGVPVTDLPLFAKQGGELSTRLVPTTKRWSVGDSIAFTAQDCHDIAVSLSMFAQSVAGAIERRIRDLFPSAAAGGPAAFG